MRMIKALNGYIESTLLWYTLFKSKLGKLGFIVNNYNKCTANKNVFGKQCTVTWYVDDAEVLHVHKAVVDDILCVIGEEFGDLTIIRGKKHTLLGMNITINDDGTIGIDMSEYIKEIIHNCGINLTSGETSPAKKDIFDVD
mmetsp:Transcript_23122/g.32572  ORF Transcript_23122/g.32572 Transcript_23122/m.32572 type:complete len:141 (-) Transcript_23122:938-1360(-)